MILIDGYNLMHAAGLMKSHFGPGGLEKARRALLGVLAGSLCKDAPQVTVIFDARGADRAGETPGEPRSGHGIRVEFAAEPDGADSRIEQLIRLDSAPEKLTVVSSDARIRSAARRRGACAVESEKFWRNVVERRRPRPSRPTSMPDKPVGKARSRRDEWLREFEGKISDDDLRELAGPFGGDWVE